MLGTEDRDEAQVGSVREQIDRRAAVAGEAGVIGNQADAFAGQRSKFLLDEDVEAGERVSGAKLRTLRTVAAPEERNIRRRSSCRRWRRSRLLESRSDRGCDARTKAGERRAGMRVNAVGQKDIEGFRAGIDPNGSAGKSCVAVGSARREQIAAWRGEGGIDVPTEAAERRHPGGLLGLGGESNAFRGQQALPVGRLSASEEQETKFGEVVGGGEQASVAGDSAHSAGARVVDDAAEQAAAARAGLRAFGQVDFFGGGDAGVPRGRGLESRVAHLQRVEECFLGEYVEGFAGETMHDLAEQNEVAIAVNENHARWRDGLGVVNPSQDLFGGCVVGRLGDRRKAAGVGHELANGDLVFAIRLEFGNVAGDRIGDAQFALLHQLQNGGSGSEDLSERGEIENRVEGHRLAPGEHGAGAVGMAEDDATVMANQKDGAGELVFGDGFFYRRTGR